MKSTPQVENREEAPGLGSRSLFIALCIVLIAAVVYVLGESFEHEHQSVVVGVAMAEEQSMLPPISQEAGVFQRAEDALRIAREPLDASGQRKLAIFYERRAYPGAPPVIPHAVTVHIDMGGRSCLVCHEQGGYVEKFSAYAPITPHPEMHNCRQCHVPIANTSLFQDTGWQSVEPPALGRTAIPGGPPPIPHRLQMRENCLACHGGAAAVREIRTGHPERVSCRQCHVPRQPDEFQP